MAFQGFGKNSGPGAPPRAESPFTQLPRPSSLTPPPISAFPPQPSPRPVETPPAWGDSRNPFFRDYNSQTQQRPLVVASSVASRNFRASVSAKIGQFQELERTRSPPLLSSDEHRSSNFRSVIGSRSDLLSYNPNQPVPQRTQSPPFTVQNNYGVKDIGPFVDPHRPNLSPPALANQQKLPGNFANSQPLRDQFSVPPYMATYDPVRSFPTKRADSQVPKRTKSPPLLSPNEVSQRTHFAQNASKRPSASPPSSGTRSNVISNTTPQIRRESLMPTRSIDGEAAVTNTTNIPAPKRTRSPPLSSTDQVFQGNSYSAEDDIERELQAKAKRLARFKDELSQPVQSTSGIGDQKIAANKHEQSIMERQKSRAEHSEDVVGDGNVLSDIEAPESTRIITGLCPDMCPGSERAERERKGDLDQYERVDGDRNQTSKSLAVKKYTRTAEREADLIRPMPVLQRTMDYLLNLLDQPYDEKLLGLYNFLWDRMRAIRMDLRMQHIFNLDAITMLEQMIRLHIIAMHELCEYTKGEGFSEGFDAHLNIEQMNKTSVELFQLYDDHRKKGIKVPTEKEFRGYYALLKLDKHPGYKVEPAELSLDLSKMTPEIRQTPEVLFARDVARACRTANFVSFFRLARKASYLQACLMHAHFAKLRTQALASLHWGLQNNQGIPVGLVAKWLGTEEEDIENLLEYHGFAIKDFEEPYMVKDGPFFNGDNDFPVKCSQLVHSKKSRMMVGDVSSPCLLMSLPTEEVKELKIKKVYEREVTPITLVETANSVQAIDEEMCDFDAVPSPKNTMHQNPMLRTVAVVQQSEAGDQMASVSPFSWKHSPVHNFTESQSPRFGNLEKPKYDTLFRNSLERNVQSNVKPVPDTLFRNSLEREQSNVKPVPLVNISRKVDRERFSGSQTDSAKENLVPQALVIEELEEELREDEQHVDTNQNTDNDGVDRKNHDAEAAEAKLKLILRIWKRRSSKKREIREQRQLASHAALDSLSLGPPIRQNKHQPNTRGEFDVDQAMRERYKKHVQSWSRLNVSDVIAGKLGARNPDAKCLCWKIILDSQMDSPDSENMGQWNQAAHFAPGTWLLSKLMPTTQDDNGENNMVISSPGLAIWKKWVPSQSGQLGAGLTCCLSVVKDAKIDNLIDSVSGVNAVLFLISESIPWELQKIRLHILIASLPSGSCLPLLIVSGSHEENPESSSTVVEKLSLHDIDKSRISYFSVVYLVKNHQSENVHMFFSDEQLRKGLEWLASLSPLQPVLSCIRTRELVLNHLNSLLEALDVRSIYEVSPEHCISAFNEALDQSLGEITATAEINCTGWPCPEISLLEESSDERRAAKLYLPNVEWSSAAKIQPLICALRDCKLPKFQGDISWLYKGSNSVKGIKNQRLQLEDCLIRYLTESSKMMGPDLATKETRVMIQNSAQLELHNLTHYIVPKWVMIFRRVFNWRLMSLSNGPFSTAHILEQHDSSIPTSRGLDKVGHEISMSASPYYVTQPSLDEMVETIMSPSGDNSESEDLEPPLATVSDPGEVQKGSDGGDLMEVQCNIVNDDNDKLAETSNEIFTVDRLESNSCELAVANTATKEADKLSKLLEQCNIMQDIIDKKLSVYF